MADKFLSRPDSKQRILRLDLSPVAPKNDSALVVTAERRRLTYFVSDQSGAWRFATRDHRALQALAVGPNEPYSLPWSRRNGAAALGNLGVAVFKRQVRRTPRLYIDLISLAADGPQLQTPEPIRIPLLDFGLPWTGIDICARFVGDELLIVTQGWVGLLDQGLLIPNDPRLILLKCPIDLLTPEGVADPASWTVHIMDEGGFDLDARFEEGRVWVVHRRSGEAASREVEQWDGNTETQVSIIDDFSDLPDLDFDSLGGDYPPVFLVSCDPATGQSTIVAGDIPGVERPQLQSINPLIITGDRIHSIQVGVEVADGARLFTPRVFESSKWAIWQSEEHWFKHKIGTPRHWQWPLNLEEIARAQWMIDLRESRLSFATLASLLPVVMAEYKEDPDNKQRLVSFIIESPEAGAIVTDFYLIETIERIGERLRWVGRNVLDIGHESIGRPPDGQDDDTMHPAEHTQFLPFFINARSQKSNGDSVNVNFGNVTGSAMTRNTLGALLVADQDLRVGLHAYVGMEDGGGRVVFESNVDPLPPTIGDPYKSFPPEIVVDPISPGRAWVELPAADWIDARLPGYFVPLSDMLRGLPVPSNEFELLFLALMSTVAEKLLRHFTPRSIGSGLQLEPDVLPLAAAMVPGSTLGIDDINPTSFTLNQATADAIQATLAGLTPASRTFTSDETAAFPVSFTFTPGVAQVGTALVFTATATPPPSAGALTFSWTLAPPDASAGPTVLDGATPTFTFPTVGDWTVTLVATAADGTTSSAAGNINVAATLWEQVWEAQRSISNDTIDVRSTSLEVSKFTIEYVFNSSGKRSLVIINYLDEHRTRLRFLKGPEQQQGRVGLQMSVVISSSDASFTGLLGAVLKLNSLDVSFNYERHFTPAVSTSDRRSIDMLTGRTFAAMDSARSRDADVETIRQLAWDIGHLTESTPNAISARPVNLGDLSLDKVKLKAELSDGAGTVLDIFSVIVTLGIGFLLFGPILAAIALAGGILTGGAGLGLLALVAIALGLGLGALLKSLARTALTNHATSTARRELSRQENITKIREGLDDGNLMTYAGEGVSEAIAIMAMRQAIRDGHTIDPPRHDQPDPDAPGQNLKPNGRERFREKQFFETIAVGEGVCRVQLRVS